MSCSCKMGECLFLLKSENIEAVAKKLIASEYAECVSIHDFYWSEKNLQKSANDSLETQKTVVKAFFKDNGYEVCFDENSNILGLIHITSRWDEDDCFFSVFAEFVTEGSYIVYHGEDDDCWRVYFDGSEECVCEEGTYCFPEHKKAPKGVRPTQLKKCIFLELGEFENIVCNAIEDVTVEYTLEGLDIYTNEDGVSCEKITNLLKEHFGVEEVTSFHSDHCEDNPGVWVVYKDGSEVQ